MRRTRTACKFCDYTAACGGGVHEQVGCQGGRLEARAFGRLGAHE